MLFTRCPDCQTTFRITADALRKADGQVRCGRCACVFNAFTELRRRSGETGDEDIAESAPDSSAGEPPAAVGTAPPARGAPSEAGPGQDDANVDGISFSSVISELHASAIVASDDDGDTSPAAEEEEIEDTSFSSARLLRLRSRDAPAAPAAPDTAAQADAAAPGATAKARFAGARASADARKLGPKSWPKSGRKSGRKSRSQSAGAKSKAAAAKLKSAAAKLKTAATSTLAAAETRAAADAKAAADTQTATAPGTKAATAADTKTETGTDAKAATAADTKTETGTDAKAARAADTKTETAADTKTARAADTQTATAPHTKTATAADTKTATAADTQTARAADTQTATAAGITAATAASPNDGDASPAWVILDEPVPADAGTARKWAIASGAAAALLAFQILHHYRSDIAGLAVVGPWFQDAYAVLGANVEPHWDLAQYEIQNWDAIAEPDADGRGNLRIAARIRNKGPREQPLPYVHVQLKDRWDSTLGSRVFTPSEYIENHRASDVTMRVGRTIEAHLEIFDPGRDAYGFEIDVCIDTPDGALRCTADDVFR